MPTTSITAELQINDVVCRDSREFVDHALELLGESQDGTLPLLVDELVANAAEAGATKVHIAIARAGKRIRVNVKDDARGSPELRSPSPTDVRGRGLRILGSLASSWGTYPLGDAKSVWFEYSPRQLDLRDRGVAGVERTAARSGRPRLRDPAWF